MFNVDLDMHRSLRGLQDHHLPFLDGEGLCCHSHWPDAKRVLGKGRTEILEGDIHACHAQRNTAPDGGREYVCKSTFSFLF